MVKVCEACGHPLPTYEALLDLTRMQQRLFSIIHKAGRAGIGNEAIMQQMYADDPTGGPESGKIIHVMKQKMRPALQKHGMKLVAKTGPGALWRLEPIT